MSDGVTTRRDGHILEVTLERGKVNAIMASRWKIMMMKATGNIARSHSTSIQIPNC